MDRRKKLSILYVRNFRGDYCDTDHLLVVAKVTERLAVNKQVAQIFNGEIFNLGKLNELYVRKECQIEILNRFAAFDNSSDSEDINSDWKNIKENKKKL